MQAELLVLRIVHVLGGVFWVGSGLFTTFFLLPAMAPTGAAAGQIMLNLQKRRLFLILPTVAVLTILSGARLMMITSTGFAGSYFATASGKTYAVSGLAAIVAFLLSIIVSRPAAVKIGTLSQMASSGGTSREVIAQEIKALQRRTTMSGTIAMILLIFATVGMAVARYL